MPVLVNEPAPEITELTVPIPVPSPLKVRVFVAVVAMEPPLGEMVSAPEPPTKNVEAAPKASVRLDPVISWLDELYVWMP